MALGLIIAGVVVVLIFVAWLTHLTAPIEAWIRIASLEYRKNRALKEIHAEGHATRELIRAASRQRTKAGLDRWIARERNRRVRNRDGRLRLMAGLAIAAATGLFLIGVFITGVVEPTPQSHSSAPAGVPIPVSGSPAPDSQSAASASSVSLGSPVAPGSDPSASSSPSDSGSAPGGSTVPASPGSSTLNPGSFALPIAAAPGNASLTNACRWQYPDNPDAMAQPVVGSNPIASYTVQCFDGGTDLGGLDLDGYCDSLVGGMHAYNPDRYGPASDQPPPWDQWECVPG